MRILIADDSLNLPQPLADVFARATRAAAAGKAVRKAPAVEETVLIARDFGAPARAAQPASRDEVDEDGCTPEDPIPPCPSCDMRDQPELHAAILDAIGIALLNRGCLEEGKRFIVAALRIRLEYFGKNHPVTASSFNSHARVLRMEDELIAAEKEVQRALKINRRVYGSRGLPVALSLNELGAIQLYQGDFKGAQRSAERGLAILRKHGLLATDPNFTRLLDIKGRALEGQRKLEPALRVLSKAVKVDEQQVGRDHPKYATHRANLATVQWARGDLEEAKNGFEHAIYVYEQVQGRPAHPNLIDTHANLGSVLVRLKDFERARVHLCKAIGLNRQLRGPAHTLVGNDHANLGRLYCLSGDRDRAREQFQKALAIYNENVRRRRLPKNHPYIKEAQVWLKRC